MGRTLTLVAAWSRANTEYVSALLLVEKKRIALDRAYKAWRVSVEQDRKEGVSTLAQVVHRRLPVVILPPPEIHVPDYY